MTKIFISYRRVDSQYVTDSIYEYIVRYFGKDNVFLDVGNIPFGVDFRYYLNEQIQVHDAVLVIIGPDWGRIMQERADQQNDFVRIEIESALQQDKLVIPVLVKNATMPDFSHLPASIQELQWRNSATIRRQPDLENDCTRLAEGIYQYVQTVGSKPTLEAESQMEFVQTAQIRPSSLDLMPEPFGWVEIPAGKVTLTKNDYLKKATTFAVAAFSIATYPVTNAQYGKFVEVGGYYERQWWTGDGWVQREENGWNKPRFWNDLDWNGADQPVVGVSWYEAVAFCRWLSDATGENILLPTEQQWQRAAQGDDNRAYPWGDKWSGNRCNNSVNPCDSNVTTSVTQYEATGKNTVGTSPFDVVDMVGNVWEWCLTSYTSGENNINRIDIRILHGGSWINKYSNNFRCDSRSRKLPDYWDYNYGFRIARS